MASDEKVNDGCMCCIDQLRWQHIADAQKTAVSGKNRPEADTYS